MENQQLAELPAEAQKLPEYAQTLFRVAFNSAHENGMSEEGAMEVAWNTVKKDYEQNAEGEWVRCPQVTNVHNKAVQSGGN
jgi:cation transport regulator